MRGPEKSRPANVKGGASFTRHEDKCGILGVGNGLPSSLLHVTRFRSTCFTACCHRVIQYLSHTQLRVSLMPLCLTVSWLSRIIISVTWCFDSITIGFLVSKGMVEFSNRPPQRITPFLSKNNPSWLITWFGTARLALIDVESLGKMQTLKCFWSKAFLLL